MELNHFFTIYGHVGHKPLLMYFNETHISAEFEINYFRREKLKLFAKIRPKRIETFIKNLNTFPNGYNCLKLPVSLL